MSDHRHGLQRDRRAWDVGQAGAQVSCPLCDRPARITEIRGTDGPVYSVLVCCDSCSTFNLTRSAEFVLRRQPAGRAVLADRARRAFAETGAPIELDVEAVERVAELFQDPPGT